MTKDQSDEHFFEKTISRLQMAAGVTDMRLAA